MRSSILHCVDLCPLGVPGVFLTDVLRRHPGGHGALREIRAVTHEFMDAQGHAFPWGQLHEQRTGGLTSWAIVPVALWDSLLDVRAGSTLTIPELHRMVHQVVRDELRGRTPRYLLVTGCQGGPRATPHSLFTLLCSEPAREQGARDWIARQLVPRLLPDILGACDLHVRAVMASSHERHHWAASRLSRRWTASTARAAS
jgi:hypothetical protein